MMLVFMTVEFAVYEHVYIALRLFGSLIASVALITGGWLMYHWFWRHDRRPQSAQVIAGRVILLCIAAYGVAQGLTIALR